MAIINQSNILNLQPGITAPVVVHMSEGDVGTKLSFKLIDGANAWTDPGNVIVAVHGRRQDGAQFGPYACLLQGDVVSFETDAAIAGAAGSGIAEIVLTDSKGNTAGSANFAVMVERATFPHGVTYTTDVSVYEAILAYSQTIPAQVTENLTAKITAEAEARQAADENLKHLISTESGARSLADEVLSARMDEFTKLPDESLSTAADAELVDIRVQADGVTASTAGVAVRNQVKTLTDGLNVIREHTKNLLVPTNALNLYITGSDNFLRNANVRGVWIECEPDTTYTISRAAGTRFAAAYSDIFPATGNPAYGKVTNYTGTSLTITTGSNANYLFVWLYNAPTDTETTFEEILSTVQIEVGSTATEYEVPYTAVDRTLRGEVSALTDEVSTVTANEGTLLTTDAIEWEIGSIGMAGHNNDSTVRIRTVGFLDYAGYNKGVSVQITKGYRCAVLWYDAQKTFLRDDYWISENKLLEAPEGAAFIRIVVGMVNEATATLDYANEIVLTAIDGILYNAIERKNPIALPDGSDLNTLYNLTQDYTMAVSGTYLNGPNDKNGRRFLEVRSPSDTTYTMQRLTNITLREQYCRLYAANAWGAWFKMYPSEVYLMDNCGQFGGRKCVSHAGIFSVSKYQNSPKAFKDARDIGIIYQDLDIVFTSDLVPVVAHSSYADNAIRIADSDTSRIYFRDHTLADLQENYVFGDSDYNWTIQTLEEAYQYNRDLGCYICIDIGGGSNNPTGSREALVSYMIQHGIKCEYLVTSELDTFNILAASEGVDRFPLGIVVAAEGSSDTTSTDTHATAVQKIEAIISAKQTLGLTKAWCVIRRERIETGGDLVANVGQIKEADILIEAYSYNETTALGEIPSYVDAVVSATSNVNYLRYLALTEA